MKQLIHLLTTLLLLVLLAACVPVETANLASDGAAADAIAAPEEEAMAETRTITHVLGTTEAPTNPQRIAVVGYNEVEELLALSITPIAKLFETPAHFPLEAEDIPLIGHNGQPNLERLLVLEPDLIIGVEWAMAEFYDELTQIAPSVVVPRTTFAEWKDALRFTADVVGRSDQVEELLADYDQRVAEVRVAIGNERLDTIKVTAFRPYGGGDGFLIWIDRSFPDVIMAEVDIQRPEAQRAQLPDDAERIDNLSLEMIPLLNADVIFFALPESGVFTASASEDLANYIEDIEASPLWAQLEAVQNDQVFKVDGAAWNEGSIIGANVVLDDLERFLAEAGN
ncbi:MAG: iron-siderophore ABC transporter substrate-binding protein [Chloroflexales bacterium]|nr:iron-siderophore ABC transporter substrate-binding protein [Chloroflexales bacterium]